MVRAIRPIIARTSVNRTLRFDEKFAANQRYAIITIPTNSSLVKTEP